MLNCHLSIIICQHCEGSNHLLRKKVSLYKCPPVCLVWIAQTSKSIVNSTYAKHLTVVPNRENMVSAVPKVIDTSQNEVSEEYSLVALMTSGLVCSNLHPAVTKEATKDLMLINRSILISTKYDKVLALFLHMLDQAH